MNEPYRRPVLAKESLNLKMNSDLVLRLKRHALDCNCSASDVVSAWIAERLTQDGKRREEMTGG